MKLNLEKCTFRVTSGNVLTYMVTKRGIEANPDQIKAIIEMRFPKTMKKNIKFDRTSNCSQQISLTIHRQM